MLLYSSKEIHNDNQPSQPESCERKLHTCFIAIHIPKEYSDRDAMQSRQTFYNSIINAPNPDNPHTLTDSFMYRFYIYKDGVVRCTPLIKNQSVDKAIVIRVAKLIEKEYPRFKKKIYTGYIYRLLTEGILGTGLEKISLDEFVEFIKDFKIVSKANVSKYAPSSIMKEIGERNDSNQKVVVSRYAQLFINNYQSMYAEIYDKDGFPPSKLKELLMI